MSVTVRQILLVLDDQHRRLVKMLVEAKAGEKLTTHEVMQRFGVSRATAKRHVAVVRRALKQSGGSDAQR